MIEIVKKIIALLIVLTVVAVIIGVIIFCVKKEDENWNNTVLYKIRVKDKYNCYRELIYGDNNIKDIELSVSRDGGKNWKELWKK